VATLQYFKDTPPGYHESNGAYTLRSRDDTDIQRKKYISSVATVSDMEIVSTVVEK
jgi:hypothetical protein